MGKKITIPPFGLSEDEFDYLNILHCCKGINAYCVGEMAFRSTVNYDRDGRTYTKECFISILDSLVIRKMVSEKYIGGAITTFRLTIKGRIVLWLSNLVAFFS